MIRTILRWMLARLFRVKLNGLENYEKAGPRVLIAANHSSYLDPILLWAFLPDDVTFAINTQVARHWWVRPALRYAKVFPMDPTQPLSVKALAHYLKDGQKAVIFPEGRITVTGSLMKIYDGAGLIAEKSGATILPIRIDGTQYTIFSHLHGVVRLRWFPPITLNILPPRAVNPPPGLTSPERRHQLGLMLSDLMSEMMFETSHYRRTVFSALLDARRIHRGSHRVVEDVERKPLTYDRLIAQSLALGRKLAGNTGDGEAVGLLLPNLSGTVAAFLGLQVYGRIPAMLNFSAGTRNLLSSCTTANIKTVLTARQFITNAKLEDAVEALSEKARVIYLEDLGREFSAWDKVQAFFAGLTADYWYRGKRRPDDPAVILFTSGSEGEPKGVVLSHANLLANREQLAARFDFNAQDVILNVLPIFHAFGLTAGTLLPLLSGMRLFLYPSPLHYRIIPEVAYDINATILFGTNTFLHGYAKHAHPYDFYSVRYVFAGAEKLQADTRRLWMEKFGLRVLEGYGATETSPVLSANTPMYYREGTVGRFLPGIQWRLEKVPGVTDGGRLHVAGPNVMLGYLRSERSGELEPPASRYGHGWYDTGDIVRIDEEGFVTLVGRIKRFAKIGGEMVSLTAVEELAARIWPGQRHAAIVLSDPKKGEKIVLATEYKHADQAELTARALQEGIGELHLPKDIRVFRELPLLATGKVDYPALTGFVREGREA